MIVEVCGDGPRHNCRDPDTPVADIQHRRLGEPDKAELARVVSAAACEKIGPREACDRDDISFRFREGIQRSFYTIEYPGEIGIDRLLPLFGRQCFDRSKIPYAGVRDQHIQLTPLFYHLADDLLLRREIPDIGS